MVDDRLGTPEAAQPSWAGAGRVQSARKWLLLAAGLAAAFALDGLAMETLKPLHDSPLSHFLRHTIRYLGVGYVQAAALLLAVIVGAVAWRRMLAAGGWGLVAFGISGALASITKVAVHRPRPWVLLPPPDSFVGYLHSNEFQSFPSGESTTSFALALALGAWFPRLRLPLVLLACVVALARVVVGNHYPSDAWAGAMLGIAVGQVVARTAGKAGGWGEAERSTG